MYVCGVVLPDIDSPGTAQDRVSEYEMKLMDIDAEYLGIPVRFDIEHDAHLL